MSIETEEFKLHYLKEVLGISSLLRPEGESKRYGPLDFLEFDGALREERLRETFEVLVLAVEQRRNIFESAEVQMLERILGALKLSKAEVLTLWTEPEGAEQKIDWLRKNLQYKSMVIFVGEDVVTLSQDGNLKICPSPTRMLQDEGLKKITWEKLKNLRKVSM